MELYGHAFYRAIKARIGEEYRLRFELDLLLDERPDFLPALDVRMHYPDGSDELIAAQIECESFGAYHDDERYFAYAPFGMAPGRIGVVYTEVRLGGRAIAGFAFGTAGPAWGGMCTMDYLMPLETYSIEGAERRFEKYLATAKNEDLER